MSDTLTEVQAPEQTLEQALQEQKDAIIDKAVRAARNNGWCGEFERALAAIFPEGSGQPRGDWYDTHGRSCRGYDHEGFDPFGFDTAGRDRDGYDRDGRD